MIQQQKDNCVDTLNQNPGAIADLGTHVEPCLFGGQLRRGMRIPTKDTRQFYHDTF